MKRAILAGTGTIAGLVSVLSYSPAGTQLLTTASDTSGGLAGMGGPASASAGVGSTATPVAKGAPTPAAGGAARAAVPKPTRTPAASRAATATTPTPPASPPPSTQPGSVPPPVAHTTAPSTVTPPAPKPKPAPKPTPKPTPTPAPPAGPKDYTGSAVTYKYGTLQVAIRVLAGKIVDAWAVSYPQGSSLPYSQMALPILRSQTLSAQSASIAGASGATLTSQSWSQSLQAALSKAGL